MEQQQGGAGAQFTYVIDKKGHCKCAKGTGRQTVLPLCEASELTEFHDAQLAQATREINGIVDDIQRNNRDPEHTLSFIQFQNRHLLVP
jgi:hypothetical protein